MDTLLFHLLAANLLLSCALIAHLHQAGDLFASRAIPEDQTEAAYGQKNRQLLSQSPIAANSITSNSAAAFT